MQITKLRNSANQRRESFSFRTLALVESIENDISVLEPKNDIL